MSSAAGDPGMREERLFIFDLERQSTGVAL